MLCLKDRSNPCRLPGLIRSRSRGSTRCRPSQTRQVREPLNNSARARQRRRERKGGLPAGQRALEWSRCACLCGRLRLGLGERGLVIPNERAQTRRRPRKGPSRMGLAGEAASRSLRHSAVATATVTRVAPTDLRPLRPKRAPRRVIQRLLSPSGLSIPTFPARAAS